MGRIFGNEDVESTWMDEARPNGEYCTNEHTVRTRSWNAIASPLKAGKQSTAGDFR